MMTETEFNNRVNEIVSLIKKLKNDIQQDDMNLAQDSTGYSSSDGWEEIRVALDDASQLADQEDT